MDGTSLCLYISECRSLFYNSFLVNLVLNWSAIPHLMFLDISFFNLLSNFVQQICCMYYQAYRENLILSSILVTSGGKSMWHSSYLRCVYSPEVLESEWICSCFWQVPESKTYFNWPRFLQLSKIRCLLGTWKTRPTYRIQIIHRYYTSVWNSIYWLIFENEDLKN